MALIGERYFITEIVNELTERKLGGVEALLRYFQDGLLMAHIEFPSFLPNKIIIPTEVWLDLSTDFLYSAFPNTTRQSHSDERGVLEIFPEFALADELDALQTVLLAVAKRNTKVMNDRYLKFFEDKGCPLNLMKNKDWEQMAEYFRNWHREFVEEIDCGKKFTLYVSNDSWISFLSKSDLSISESKIKPGRKNNEHWGKILDEIIFRLLCNKKIENMEKFSLSVYEWAASSIECDSVNEIPKPETIRKRLAQLQARVRKNPD